MKRQGVPPSFGRAASEPPPAEEEEFRVVGGEATVTLSSKVVLDDQSLAALYAQVKRVVSAAIRDAYRETVGAPMEPPPGGDGGAPGG